ncbi:MAG: hypothetical protein IAF08_01890 [Rhizobacter sp.]|nr:hypothetical protein [Chlorobiales bacterium]
MKNTFNVLAALFLIACSISAAGCGGAREVVKPAEPGVLTGVQPEVAPAWFQQGEAAEREAYKYLDYAVPKEVREKTIVVLLDSLTRDSLSIPIGEVAALAYQAKLALTARVSSERAVNAYDERWTDSLTLSREFYSPRAQEKVSTLPVAVTLRLDSLSRRSAEMFDSLDLSNRDRIRTRVVPTRMDAAMIGAADTKLKVALETLTAVTDAALTDYGFTYLHLQGTDSASYKMTEWSVRAKRFLGETEAGFKSRAAELQRFAVFIPETAKTEKSKVLKVWYAEAKVRYDFYAKAATQAAEKISANAERLRQTLLIRPVGR